MDRRPRLKRVFRNIRNKTGRLVVFAVVMPTVALMLCGMPALVATAVLAQTESQAQEELSLIVGVKQAPPFVMRHEDGSWSGLAIELWQGIAEVHELDYTFQEYDLTGLLSAVEQQSIDVAVGALTMTSEREKRLDFSHPYFISGLGIAVRADQTRGWFSALAHFFSLRFLRVVGILALVLLASGLVVWLFERKKNPEMFGGPHHRGIGSGFWWAAVTMTTVGYGDKAPVTTGGRVIALLWMFASLVAISGFTAAIASALTIGQLDSPIKGPEDLAKCRVASVGASASGDWLRGRGISYGDHNNVEAALEAVRQGQADAAVYDAPILAYLVKHDPGGELVVLGPRFDLQSYAFAVPPGSEVLEPINQTILRITSSEHWREELHYYIGGKH